MSDQWRRSLAFFAIAQHVNRNHAFQNKTKYKCNDHVRCENLEALQQNRDLFYIFGFLNVYVRKGGAHTMDTLHEWEYAKNCE